MNLDEIDVLVDFVPWTPTKENDTGHCWVLIRGFLFHKITRFFRSFPLEATSRGHLPIHHLGMQLVAVSTLPHQQ